MKGDKGTMNIEFSEKYDQEDDIYYVTFKTGEPSYVEEVDDVLLLEMGMFTKMPTGFRIMNYNKNKISHIDFIVKKVKKTIEKAVHDIEQSVRQRENQIEHALDKIAS